ncbi:MAG: MATE family efflux transporter [Candidatus Tectomicrobia bacterium]|nr:MATE family efflux transporter [Candidatus Tectomicrobia bacterium]
MRTDQSRKGSYREVWLLAYPNIISMLLHNLMSIVDTIMIGSVGMAALAGVSLAQLVLSTLFYIYKGMADSVLTFTAQYFGAQQDSKCGEVAWQGLYMGGFIGLLLLLFIPLVKPLFFLMKPADDAIGPGVTYLTIVLIGESIGPLEITLIYFLRGLGDTKTPMRVSLLGNGLNVIGNYFLIFGHGGFPPLGVVGAAISTNLAEFFIVGTLFWIFLSRRIDRQYATRRFVPPDFAEMKRILKIALPVSAQGLLEVGGFTLFSVMIGRMGTAQLALNHIVLRLVVFAFLPAQGMAVAASTLVGQYLGARDEESAERSGRGALHFGVAYMGFLGLLFFFIPQAFLVIFTRDREVLAIGGTLLRLLGVVQAFDGIYWVCGGVLKGAGDTRWIMVVSMIYNWFVFLPLSFLLGMVLEGGIVGAWAGFAFMVVFQGFTFLARFKRGTWKKISLIDLEENVSR